MVGTETVENAAPAGAEIGQREANNAIVINMITERLWNEASDAGRPLSYPEATQEAVRFVEQAQQEIPEDLAATKVVLDLSLLVAMYRRCRTVCPRRDLRGRLSCVSAKGQAIGG